MALLFSVHDAVSDSWSAPYKESTVQSGIRTFSQLVSQGENLVALHPQDYFLYVVADFDEQTGIVESRSHQRVASAVEFKPLKSVES